MTKHLLALLAAAGVVIVSVSTALPQSTDMPTEDEADVVVQPEAIKALDAMAAYLRTLKEFRLTATTTQDEVLDNGEKLEIAGRSVYEVRVPDRLRLETVTDNQARTYFYDGKTVTQYAPRLDYYSVFEAPPTIAETIVAADQQYAVELPLADLFFWGTERSNVADITSAFFAGESSIGGDKCNHYAYRIEGYDFQVWIRKHGSPLPCRLVITTMDDESRPDYGATLDWDVEPAFGDGIFMFAAPPGVQKIDQEPVAAN